LSALSNFQILGGFTSTIDPDFDAIPAGDLLDEVFGLSGFHCHPNGQVVFKEAPKPKVLNARPQ
jgi:hypothetical protein